MELMPNGSLHDLLHVFAALPTWPKRMQIAWAVQFLHIRTMPWSAATLNREIHIIELAKVISYEVMTHNLDP